MTLGLALAQGLAEGDGVALGQDEVLRVVRGEAETLMEREGEGEEEGERVSFEDSLGDDVVDTERVTRATEADGDPVGFGGDFEPSEEREGDCEEVSDRVLLGDRVEHALADPGRSVGEGVMVEAVLELGGIEPLESALGEGGRPVGVAPYMRLAEVRGEAVRSEEADGGATVAVSDSEVAAVAELRGVREGVGEESAVAVPFPGLAVANALEGVPEPVLPRVLLTDCEGRGVRDGEREGVGVERGVGVPAELPDAKVDKLAKAESVGAANEAVPATVGVTVAVVLPVVRGVKVKSAAEAVAAQLWLMREEGLLEGKDVPLGVPVPRAGEEEEEMEADGRGDGVKAVV